MPIPGLYRPASTPGLATAVQVAVDGWVGGGTASDGTEWWVTDVQGWFGAPPVRLFGVDRPQDHGEFDAPAFYAPRVVTIKGTAIAVDQARAQIAADIISSVCSDPSGLYTAVFTEVGRGIARQVGVRLNADTKVDLGVNWVDW